MAFSSGDLLTAANLNDLEVSTLGVGVSPPMRQADINGGLVVHNGDGALLWVVDAGTLSGQLWIQNSYTSGDSGWVAACDINDANGYWGFGVNSPTVRIHLAGGTPGNANSGVAAAWNVHSSIRWKDNIETVTDATAVVNTLRPVTFQYKDPETQELSDVVEYGFIAEEMREQIPSVVQDDPDDPEFAQSVDYARLTSLLTAAIQEQQTQIDALTARIEALEA